VLGTGAANPALLGNISVPTNGTILVQGSVASTNNIRCVANSKYLSATGPTVWMVTVGDSTAPAVYLRNPPNNNYTNLMNVTFYENVTDTAVSSCALVINDSINQTRTDILNPGNNNFSAYGLAEGQYSWYVNCTDTGGLIGTSTPRNITVDRNAPNITLNRPDPAEQIAFETVTFNWTASDTSGQNMSCNLYVDGTLNISNQNSLSGVLTNVTVGGFSVGTHNWYVNCTDLAGNRNGTSPRSFNITDISPTVTLLTPLTGTTLPDRTANLTFNASDNNGFQNCSLLLNGAFNMSSYSISNNQMNNFTVNNLANGTYNWTVTCFDTGGLNDTWNPAWTFTIDTEPPVTQLMSPSQSAQLLIGSVTYAWNVTDNMDNSLLCNITVDNQRINSAFTSNNSPGTYPQSSVQDGVHNWNVTCSDNGGLSGSSATRNYNMSRNPGIILGNPSPGAYILPDYALTYTPSDNDGIKNCSLYIDEIFTAASDTVTNGASNNFTRTGIGEGLHYWNVTCYDNGTYVNTNWSSTRNFTVDATNPVLIPYNPSQDEVIQQANVTFNWSVTDNLDLSLSCALSVDGLINASGLVSPNGSVTTYNLTFNNGRHNWSVNCSDDAGNWNTSAWVFFNVTVPPTVTLTSPYNDQYLNYAELVLEYIPNANAALKNCSIFFDGVYDYTDPAPVNDEYNYFYVNTTQGTHNWTVSCYDDNDLQGNASQSNLTVDLTNPNVTANSPYQDQVIDTNLVVFNWTFSDEFSPNASCSVFIGGTPRVINVSSYSGMRASGSYSVADGNYSYYVNCTETASNWNVSSTINFSVKAPPVISLVYPPNNTYSRVAEYNFTYNPYDGGYQIPNCSLYINEVYQTSTGTPNEGNNNTFTAGPLSEDVYNWTVQCIDQDNNVGIAPHWYLTVDSSAPNTTLTAPNIHQVLVSSNVTFNWTVNDNLDSLLSCNLTIDGSLNISNVSVANNSWNPQSVAGFNDGSHNWSVACWDDAINMNVTAARNFSVQEPPKVGLAGPENLLRTNAASLLFAYYATDNSGSVSSCDLIFDGKINTSNTTISVTSLNNVTAWGMSHGTYDWTVNCTDQSGNEGTNDTLRTLYIDQLGPNITLNYPGNDTTFNSNNLTFNWTPVDFANTSVNCTVLVTDAPTTRLNTLTNSTNVTQITRFNGLSDGWHYWNVTCWDDLNNSASSNTHTFRINQPDLFLNQSSIIFNNANPDLNDTITINATIWNIGGSDANNVVISFWDGYPGTGSYISNTTVSVSFNSSAIASISWNITAGYHTIWALADPDNVIAELDESNNNVSTDISVLWAEITDPPNQTITSDNTPDINVTGYEYTGGLINYTVLVDGSSNGQIGNLTDGVSKVITLSSLSEGIHAINVRVRDVLGRLKNGTAVYIQVDTIAPFPIFNTPNMTFFNSSTPLINFTVTDGQDTSINWTLYIGGISNVTGLTINGSWQNISIGPLNNGSYVLMLEGFDDAGNRRNSTAVTIYVDQVSPELTLLAPEGGTNFTVRTVQLNYSVTDNLDWNLTCYLNLDNNIVDSRNASNGSLQTYTASNQVEGNHAWNVTCIDDAYNTFASPTRIFGVYSAPNITLISPANDTLTGNSSVTFFFNSTDETGLLNCSMLVNGLVNGTKTTSQILNGGPNNFTVEFSDTLQVSWAILCYDNSSLRVESTSEDRSLTVDRRAPSPRFETANQSWFATHTPSISFNITDDVDTSINYTIYADGSLNTQGAASNATSASAVLASLVDGVHELIIEGVDDAGNRANGTGITIYIDTTAPNITLLYPANNSNSSTRTTELNFTVVDSMSSSLLCNLTRDGSIIRSNFNATNDSVINTTVNGLNSGLHYWNVSCVDTAGNRNDSITFVFSVLSPDLVVNSASVNTSSFVEFENVTITANISNLGLFDASNITVQFYKGDPDNGGTQIDANKTISSLAIGASTLVSVNFTLPIGPTLIVVMVDPPLVSNGSISESNETNNRVNTTTNVGHYEIVAGDTLGQLEIADALLGPLYEWNVSNSTGSNLFVADSDSSISFQSLNALGRTNSGVLEVDDFGELDAKLNSSSFSDSINSTWLSVGSSKELISLTVFGSGVVNVSVVNSTNSSNFQTGILWDDSDGGTEYNGTQDIVFVSVVNDNMQGAYGTYDYEIRIPATLRDYTGTVRSVTFYAELK
jgi:hypothetical protein